MTQIGTKKSRKGCTNCKKRRVKCDEQAPCANCIRRGEQCSLLGLPSNNDNLGPTHNDNGLPRTPEEWIQDLELMHHYDRATLLQPLGIRDDCQHLWQENIPREAVKHPFLMHGILASSALHIAHERPEESDKYLQLCDKHQTKALELFRSVLCTDITPELSTALFALSSTTSILSMGRSCAEASLMPEPHYISMEQVSELFLLTRGVRDLIQTCMDWVSIGPLGPLLDSHFLPSESEAYLPAAVRKQFSHLQLMLEDCCPVDYRPDCERALACLEDVYCNVGPLSPMDELETNLIWRWMFLVPSAFVKMISVCFPPALVVLAHFAAVSLSVRRVWYTKNWGHYVLSGVGMVLYGTDAYHYLDWPLEQAKTKMMALTKIGEIDSVMNNNSPPAAKLALDETLYLDGEINEADLNFVDF